VIAAIVNPAAAAGSAARRWPGIARMLAERVGPVRTFYTKAPGHAAALARELAGSDVLVVGGGDGTLNEVVNGALAAGSRARVGVVPLATGGDFARTIGLRSVGAAVEAVAAARWRRVDVFRARFRGSDGAVAERLFVNSASFGLAGVVAREAAKWPLGGARYLAAAIPALASGRSYGVSVESDGEPAVSFDATTAAVCNGQFQGGGIRIAPEAALDDGLADVTVVERVSLWEVLRRLPILYNGRLYSHPRVRHWRAARVRVEGEAPLEVDGEAVGTLPVEIEAAGTVEVAVAF
jgi:YegS/Rv2252/BmrU family lipid kinase